MYTMVLDIKAKLIDLDEKIASFNKAYASYVVAPAYVTPSPLVVFAATQYGGTPPTPPSATQIANEAARDDLLRKNSAVTTLLQEITGLADSLGESSLSVYHKNVQLSQKDLYDMMKTLSSQQAQFMERAQVLANVTGAEETGSMEQRLAQKVFWLYLILIIILCIVAILASSAAASSERSYLLIAFALAALVLFYNTYRQVLQATADASVDLFTSFTNNLRELFLQN